MSNALEAIINLNCLVLGGDSRNVFTIEIARGKNVSALKELIKDKNSIAFRDVDANTLTLWKVPKPLLCDCDTFKETIEGLNLQDENCLLPVKTLSRIFSELEPEHLHVIVKAPAFRFLCWIRGQPTTNILQIPISQADTVRTLKRLIKELPEAGIGPEVQTIQLYKPKNPVPSPYHKNLSNVVLAELGEPLENAQQLSKLFVAPLAEGHIHIIVDAPHLMIYCWLRGSAIEGRFDISINSDAPLGKLKDRMGEQEPQLYNVAQSRMRLYRIPISEAKANLQESLDTLNAGHLLQVAQPIPLSDYFRGVPVLERLAVIVQVSTDNSRSTNPPRRVHHVTEGGDPIKVARDTFLANIDDHSKKKNKSQSRSKRSQSPSSGSHPSSFRERQGNEKLQIPCGRPRDLQETIPTTLLHPVFGQFIDDCHTHAITEEDNNLVEELANVMSALYATEDKRVNAVSKVLAGYWLDLRLNGKVQGTPYVTDADISAKIDGHPHPYVIAEFKNEAATSSSEPYVQAVAYYLESTRMYASKMSGSVLPSFLFILFGPYIVFAGAVWTLRPAVQILSSPLAFHYHSTDTDNQIAAARHMAAFRKAVRSLKKYYEALPGSGLTNTLSHPMLFPYPTSFTSLDDNKKTSFNYTEQLAEDGAKSKRLIFFGTLTEGSAEAAICIKFVQRYSRDAHLHCASSGFAPRLRGFEKLPGGWHMVVMDRLVGFKLLADLSYTECLPKSVLQGVRSQLKTLHERNLVHGDIRDTNILVKRDDKTKVMIIDFDWAGELGQVRYPPYVNYSDIWRPDDARDGNLIHAGHDDAMLDIILTAKGEHQ
ncbi:hypothetical protein PAXRUDRAFT_835096 [Paxillus rubicundulus Ve08.2h10]|uniref:Protein kinase domain-containing protein n=1 Tax=Paxillus rubicundulus Ve08.2h10 TaxID=930991 RepID=A0A0D0D0Q2_9AGAM|nr:hypothetical protein PAXRUDRAFT_835096 [Paxillus rubicundulus Ve08.2h10]